MPDLHIYTPSIIKWLVSFWCCQCSKCGWCLQWWCLHNGVCPVPLFYCLFPSCSYMVLFFLSFRFCLSETSCAQEDNYPSGLCIKVNGKLFPLPVSCSRLRCFKFRKNAASNVPTKPFPPAGLRTATKKRRRTEETWKASEHYLPRPSLLRSTQSDFSHVGAWNWKSKNTLFLWILPLFFSFFLLVEFEMQSPRPRLSCRPIPCLCTWWGSWRHHCSCRGYGWRASETLTTPEH